MAHPPGTARATPRPGQWASKHPAKVIIGWKLCSRATIWSTGSWPESSIPGRAIKEHVIQLPKLGVFSPFKAVSSAHFGSSCCRSDMRRLCGAYFSHGITTCVKVFLNTSRHISTLLTHRHATIFARDGASRSRLDGFGKEVYGCCPDAQDGGAAFHFVWTLFS